jgi:4-hydroxythreonine-4-phosphate dehydrogenase
MSAAARRAPPSAISAPLALTMGDPAGIAPDITLAAWHALRGSDEVFALVGDADVLRQRAERLGSPTPITVISELIEATSVFGNALPVLSIPCPAVVVAGKPDPRNAAVIIASIERAVAAVKEGAARAMVTNPIAKSVLMAEGFPHPGHTEFLGALAETHFGMRNVRPVMLLASEMLKVVPLTVHIPLVEVPKAVTSRSIIETARILHRSLIDDFGIHEPRIAVTGLNPHAGEDGKMGDEDARVIAIAIGALRDEGLTVTGPHPADTLFHAAARETYDAVLAMYHDQALIPIKTLAFDSGVNVTIGLPFVRTSPDHGTAFSIAGTGEARATSLIEALKLADRMAQRRAFVQSETV